MEITAHEKRRVAYHEAGHAVAAVVMKIPLKRVTIVPEGDSSGTATLQEPSTRVRKQLNYGLSEGPCAKDTIERRVVFVLAGDAAEKKLLRSCTDQVNNESDLRTAEELVQQICHSDEEYHAYFSLLLTRTLVLVDRNWSPIENVASALLERSTLSGRVVKRIVEESLEAEFRANYKALIGISWEEASARFEARMAAEKGVGA
jgi:ATP-dependent Zn protease